MIEQAARIPAEASLPAGAGQGKAASAAPAAWRRWLQPSLFDVLLVAVPFWFFNLADGGLGLVLADGDTGWHIRTGQWILEHKQFAYRDLFSFSRQGEPWFAWEWLSDVFLALLHQAAGLQAVALFGMVAGALYCGIVFRHMIWRGVNLWIALPLAFLAYGSVTLHLLARPHLFTLLLLPAAAWWVEADLRRPARSIWLLVPLAALWANLHGGWLALVALLALASVGAAAEAFLGDRQWGRARRYGALTALCLAASLANPYGWKLHAHIWQYLRADYILNIVGEFRAPSFRGEPMLHYEITLLAAVAASGVLLLRGRVVPVLWILFWAHASLQSARHIPLFAGVALPLLGVELQRLWDECARRAGRRSVAATLGQLAAESAPQLRRTSLWPAALLAAVALRVVPSPQLQDFPAERFPRAIVESHGARLEGARILTQDQWADYLIYRMWPRVRVFFDGRSDFYGRDLAMDYLAAMEGKPRWQEVLDKYRFDTVLVPPAVPLASLLKMSPRWTVVADDGQAILFVLRREAVWQQARRGAAPSCPNCSAPAPNEIP
jgi:hypothetical protein